MDKNPPLLGIMILNRNGKQWLAPLFESIGGNGYASLRIYLVDNASDDGSVEMTLESFPEVTIIRMSQNMGYCMAYNMAMPYAFADGCEWVVWANNDIRLEHGCLGELNRVGQSDPRIGVVGPAFLAWERDEPNYYMLGNHPAAISAMMSRSREPIDVDWVEGSFLMVRRGCFETVGPLDPYLYFYCEETDFCRRVRYRGWRVVLVPSAYARHYAGGWSADNRQNKLTSNLLQVRNYYIYHFSNPFQGFRANLADACHLFLVYLRAYIPGELTSAWFHISLFAKLLSEIRPIYMKWSRDRQGGQPPATVAGFQSAEIKVIHGRNFGK
ncbi:MAG: glycosyltransferase family 2 protein [Thermodesulfobacteriota bacterium]|jgi:GT2 family glycosyltransferase